NTDLCNTDVSDAGARNAAPRAMRPVRERCSIQQLDARRELDLRIEVPPVDLEAVCSHTQWRDIYDRIAELISEHRTTLVFVNTRARAERIAHLLAERIGGENVASHHGSLSKDRRLALEERLKAGQLRALVATASLELGIDIGTVDLVCQIESPRSVSTFLQRIGRSGHALGRTPKGRLFPTTRDELMECVALLEAIEGGRLDRVHPPEAPLDILAQQITAEASCEPWREDDLFALCRRAVPFRQLRRTDFDEIVELLSEGIPVGMGKAAELLHRDRVNGVVRGRRSARRTAIESGGAIPDTADYRVLAEPDQTYVGTINEDFAIESQRGDIFLLGSTSWQIRKIESGTVRVADAKGAAPTIPFWLGEAPSRTFELSEAVSRVRREWPAHETRSEVIPQPAREQVERYLEAEQKALGIVPSQTDVVVERFFDEAGGMQLVVHAPFGGRINRAWGLALRKRFCKTFDFELQAAATDDAILLSLGAHQSFPLDQVFGMLRSDLVEQVVTQALLASPMFGVRWRWNASRALALLRQKHGKRVPPPIQRMRADDLMAAVFPRLAACQENVTGPIELPDHPLVRQTVHDCLHEAMDVEGLRQVLQRIEAGEIRMHARDTAEPSPFAHEMLSSKPWSYLDDAPLEERRARAVQLRRTLPEDARDLGALDPEAIAAVEWEARPEPRNPEEMHELLLSLVHYEPRPLSAVPSSGPRWSEETPDSWGIWFEELVHAGRAARAWLSVPGGEERALWFAVERLRAIESLYPDARIEPAVKLDGSILGARLDEAEGLTLLLRGWIEVSGPSTIGGLAERLGLTPTQIEIGLTALEGDGTVLRGRFRAGADEEFCERRLLARIHRRTLDRLRQEIEPVSAQEYLRFLLRWQHAARGTQLVGRRGLLEAIAQLQGFEAPVRVWERDLLPARVSRYEENWLDELCFTGQVVWARLSAVQESDRGSVAAANSVTPISFALREQLPLLLAGTRGESAATPPTVGIAAEIHALLESRGALFVTDIAGELRRLKTEVERGLWELVARGLVTADGIQALRTLLSPEGMGGRASFERRVRRLRQRGLAPTVVVPSGRWSLLRCPLAGSIPVEEVALFWADLLLRRYGVVLRDTAARESLSLPWREILRALRRKEARGEVRGGRFVAGVSGEQYALPEAVSILRQTRRLERDGEVLRLSAADPLNLAGILTPGGRIPATTQAKIAFTDGLPVALAEGV
ncbi:MAG: hypothetical protein IT349_15825, partial [Candidatus Eisenbacteria bacterium]|nr:hypothetical protein [Candidatus Eisenbacteria bacterium]